jgi:predicted RNase H-related nuclease YkuK (DUF458 family)
MELNLNFKRLGDHTKILDLKEYAREQVAMHPTTRIYVGSDSHNTNSMTNLATVIVFHYGNNGAHVAYRTIKIPKIKDRFSRLWMEVTSSIEIAQFIKNEADLTVDFVDLDLNEDPRHQSNTVLRSALGYVEGLGFEPRWKPFSPFACSVADTLCR